MNNEDYINMDENQLRKMCNIKGLDKCDKMNLTELRAFMYNIDKIYKMNEIGKISNINQK